MRLYDGLQRFELYSTRDAHREEGDEVPARELTDLLRHGPRHSLERVVDYLQAEFFWHSPDPTHGDQHERALDRLVELIDIGQITALAFRPSGSEAGEVPDEDDVQELSELIEDEEDEEVAAGAQVEPPMGIEPEAELEPPAGFDVGFEVAEPEMPAFDFEVG